MKSIQKFNIMITLYLAVIIFLLFSVLAVPLAIRWDWTITKSFIIDEEIFETALIAVLFTISFLIVKRFRRKLTLYEQKFSRADREKSKLLSRLADAFRYIGTVNVELQEIQSILTRLDHYPKTKKEFKKLQDYLSFRAMTIAKSPWLAVRIIDKTEERTLYEHQAARPGSIFPKETMGNREILENRPVPGMTKIITSKRNMDLMTVCILPKAECSDEEKILIQLILNWIEMYFLLYHTNFSSDSSKTGEERVSF